MMARMKLGQIVATRGVVGLMRENNDFAAFVHRAFQRYPVSRRVLGGVYYEHISPA